jgi:3-oxoacyl-[acyl-carrier protein] reductase
MSNTYDFNDQTVIVTGAGRGIGLEVSRGFARMGAHVWMVDMDADVVEAAAKEVGATPALADVTSSDDVERVVAAAIEETGRIDVVFNNAGLLRDKVLWKLSDEDWDLVVDVSLGGTFKFTRACVPHFRERGYGRIVNVTSYTGLRGNVGQAPMLSLRKSVTPAARPLPLRPPARAWRPSTAAPSRRRRGRRSASGRTRRRSCSPASGPRA